MLASFGKFIVRIADLVEAEGRLAARHLIQLGTVMAVVFAAAALGVASLLVLAAALYLALESVMHRAAAMGLTGLALVLAAGGVAFAAFSLNQQPVRRPSPPATPLTEHTDVP